MSSRLSLGQQAVCDRDGKSERGSRHLHLP
jgi:hypothetical protein